MPIIRGGSQPTLEELDQESAVPPPQAPPPASRRRLRRGAAPPAPPPPAERIGVVFVHGIGGQKPGETLLEWSRPMIKILTEWRERHDMPPDPVVASQIDFSGSTLPMIELEIPEQPPDDSDPNTYPAQTWFVTEAWWASDVQPPSLGTMTRWLVQDMGRVVAAVKDAANERRHADSAGLSWWVRLIDSLQSFAVGLVVGVLWSLGSLVGLVYGVLRSLPVVGDKVSIAQLDMFLVDWFGDLRLLLHDQAQSANIRGRLRHALMALRDDYHCESVVIVAHSGGVIVSLTTLSDPLFATPPNGTGSFPVTRLVTIGQAMGVAWRLWDAWKRHLPQGDRLIRPPYEQYPGLRWIDFWGTYDPAPAGKFDSPPPNGEAAGEEDPASEAEPSIPTFNPQVSHAVWNRMSFREDHGTYWDNEEEFVAELVREIDTAPDNEARKVHASRFLRDPVDRATAIRRRIERVAILGWWRWLCAVAAGLALLGAWIRPTTEGHDRLADIGSFTAREYAKLPGHEAASGPLDAIANIAGQVGEVPGVGPIVAILGQALVVLAVVVAAVSVPGWFGTWQKLARAVDPAGRLAKALQDLHWPGWLPPRVAVAVAIYVLGAAIIAIGSALSVTWVLDLRTWLAQRVASLWTPSTGDVVLGALVVILVFVVVEVWGASRWQGWDERERWQSRLRPLPAKTDRSRVKIQALLFVVLLVVIVGLIIFVQVS